MKKYLIFALLLLLTVTTQAQQNNTRAEHRLTIKYLYASDLSTAAPDSILTLAAGRDYSV